MQESIQKAVAGRAIQERFESDSRAIRSDSDNLNEKSMIFVRVMAEGQSDSSVPSYPLYNIKRGDGMKLGGLARVEAFTVSKGGSRILPALSPEVQSLRRTRTCLIQTGAGFSLNFFVGRGGVW